MAEKRKFLSNLLIFSSIAFSTCISLCSSAKLNEPKILLPYYSNAPSSYQIEINDARGCFKWSSSRPEVVSVTTNEDPACSHSVTVTAEHRDPSRVTTFLLAENEETGEVLRCDVIVDSISSIGIETTTRELYLEDSPEKFQMWARDSEGNTFSTLDATPFQWELVSDSESDTEMLVRADDILRIIPFADSSYDTPPHIEVMETRGLRGDTILVEGVKTGAANVEVRLQDPAYSSVAGDTVRLIVIANIMLSPPDSYILLFTSLSYRAHVLRQGVKHDISLPSTQYLLEVKNTDVCTLDTEKSQVYGEILGSTQVVLRDKNMPANLLEAFHQPTASVHVVLPGFIGFTVRPGGKWVLEVGRIYEITVNVLDKEKHRIHLSESVRLATEFVNRYFDVLKSSVNGSYHVVRAKEAGHTDIKSALTSVIRRDSTDYKISPQIDGVQRLDIFEPIRVTPSMLAFPWVSDIETVYSTHLQARGGSGVYDWSTNDSSIAELGMGNGSHIQMSTRNRVGVSHVVAKDAKNPAHTGDSMVYVVPPEEMMFNPEHVEVEVGTELILPLSIFSSFNSERITFTDCTQLPLEIASETDVFGYIKGSIATSSVKDSCATLRLLANRAGHTVVTASYFDGSISLKASVTIAAFDPLLATDPEMSSVLALGSSRILTFTGGPQPWVLDTSEYFEIGEVDDEYRVVSLTKLKGTSVIHKLSAACSELGEQDITLTVGNRPTKTNRYPATRSASIRVFCKEPAGVQLKPQVPQPLGLPPCPVALDSDLAIPAHNYRELDINVVVTDDQGRLFDNISSLHFVWSVSDDSLGSLRSTDSVLSSAGNKASSPVGFTWYQTLVPKKVTGILTVTLDLNWKLNKQVTLSLVPDAVLLPAEVTVFNHPQSSATLDVKGGSSYFMEEHEPEDLATVKFSEQSRQVVVSPLADGNLKVKILDLCLTSQFHAESIIQMSGAHSILLQVRDKVQQGNSLTAVVRVLDHQGDPLPAKYFQLMNLVPSLDSNSQRYVTVSEMVGDDGYSATFTVKGVELGTANLGFTAQAHRGANITSNVQDIQVFPPLRLNPRNVTILVGAALGVLAVGGPQPQSSIEYHLLEGAEQIATISGSGLVEARAIGSVKVRAQAVGVDDETGERIVYSEDTGEVHVVKLVGVRLYAPLSRLQTNTKMPVYAMGLSEHQTPFSFANVFPPLSFHWSTSNGEVASLQSVYHQSQIVLPVEGRFSQQLLAKREGHVTVKLKVSVQQKLDLPNLQQITDNEIVSDEQHIQVFNSLKLLSPTTDAGQVLMTPNTEARLITNRDGAAHMTYHVQSGTKLLSVKSNGEMVSGSQSGSVSVLVTSVEGFGTNQTLLLLIKIKPVSYIMFNCETVFKTERPQDFVPAGSVLKFRVSSHDEVGQKFDFTNTQLRFRPNRFDLLQVTAGAENGTVVVHAPQVSPYSWGGTALKVWDVKQPRVADYININVQKGIHTAPSYTVGDVICLKSLFLTSAGGAGMWSTDDTSKLVVDCTTGYALATGPGHVSINYELGYQDISSQVHINPITRLQLDSGSVNYVSMSKKRFDLPVQINNGDKGSCTGVSRPSATFPYRCEMTADFKGSNSHMLPDISSIVDATPAYDEIAGSYSCSLSAKAISAQLKSILSGMEAYISVTASSINDEVTSSPFILPFLPPADIRTKELYLTAAEPSSYIEVSAISSTIGHVSVKIEGRLSSMLHHSSASRSGDVYRIPIRLSTYSPESADGSLTVMDKLTDVSYEIRVHILSGNATSVSQSSRIGRLLWDNTDLLIFVVACVIVTTVCLLLGSYTVFGSKKPQTVASDTKIFQNSPISSIGSSPQIGDCGGSPCLRQRASGGTVALWSSGYVPQEANQSDMTLFKKSPSKLMSPSY